jgi:hypothetical protein
LSTSPLSVVNDTSTHNDTVAPFPFLVDYWSISSYPHAPYWERRRFPLLVTNNHTNRSAEYAPKVDQLNAHVLVDFPELVGKQNVLDQPVQRRQLLMTEDARNRARALVDPSMEFLFGLLFHQALVFQVPSQFLLHNRVHPDDIAMSHRPLQLTSQGDATSNTMETSIVGQTTNTTMASTVSIAPYWIALHSRHSKGQSGRRIQKEVRCLRKLLDGPASFRPDPLLHPNRTRSPMTGECRICLMSDRPATVQALAKWLQRMYPTCIVVDAVRAVPTTSNINATTSFSAEHGPNAGAAFFHELNVCQHYTDGFIGTRKGGSSSTSLLEERIAYQHHLKQKQSQAMQPAGPQLEPTSKCWLV